MKRVLIIGGGFGGLTAASILCKSSLRLDVTLIDKKLSSDFLPNLPDVIGRGMNPEFLTCKIEALGKEYGFKFINEEVVSVSLEKKQAQTASGVLNYDYLIIASGSETNFYGNENIKNFAYKLDDAEDAKTILKALKQGIFDTFIIAGGGYTGVEVATNLRLFLDKNKKHNRIIIVERSPSILGSLPGWMKNYVSGNLKRLNVDILVNGAIEKIEEDKVYISVGEIFNKACVIWAAGVKTSDFIQNLNVEKNRQGRINVDDYLRLNDNCFVIGDAANFSYNSVNLRMAVQFAIAEGASAAINIIKTIKGQRLHKFKPVDLGYIIPMANNRSCGAVFGINLTGFLPTVFHFVMCIYRSWGLRNKFGIIKSLLT